jgi:hypothetical protein
MTDTSSLGPYARLNSPLAVLPGRLHLGRSSYPYVLGKDEQTGRYQLVPIDETGWPRPDWLGLRGALTYVDPTDRGALVHRGIDAAGQPYGYSFRDDASRSIRDILEKMAPRPRRPETPAFPSGGLRGDLIWDEFNERDGYPTPSPSATPLQQRLGLDDVAALTAGDMDLPIAPERSDPNPYGIRDLWERRMGLQGKQTLHERWPRPAYDTRANNHAAHANPMRRRGPHTAP